MARAPPSDTADGLRKQATIHQIPAPIAAKTISPMAEEKALIIYINYNIKIKNHIINLYYSRICAAPVARHQPQFDHERRKSVLRDVRVSTERRQ
ncbi:hypothetical protein CHELA20_50105 [Hyphomicrobiales bacterium]|nr:hypothetical protein CHELA41_20266 [Hyphomicrobiales bacterium]CAH1666718.1 hypothetical protein CHELA20_50105 [Hyphomicrobiales bacterium]